MRAALKIGRFGFVSLVSCDCLVVETWTRHGFFYALPPTHVARETAPKDSHLYAITSYGSVWSISSMRYRSRV
ncbi:hypothetical protein F5Y16DRAFT_366954, partial [Xylariaceae sp. FL0255]